MAHPAVTDAAIGVPDVEANAGNLAPLQPLTIATDEGTWIAVDVSPDGETIAFDLLGKIFSLPIAGGKATQLTTGPAFDEMPRFSRDGKYVLFSSDRGSQIQLWRVPLEGGTPTLAPPEDSVGVAMALDLNGTNSDPATWVGPMAAGANGEALPQPPTLWSPGGRYGVRSTRPGHAHLFDTRECRDHAQASLLLVDRNTGTTRPIASAGPNCMRLASMPPSAFTPDGRAFITAHSGKIWRVSIPSSESEPIPFSAQVQMQVRPRQAFPHRIPDDPLVHARLIEHARVSPDRKQVVFGAFDRVWIQSLPSGTPRRLTRLEVGEFQPVWSPDGRYVAFVTWDDATEDGAIWRSPLTSGCMKRISCLPERLTSTSGRYMHLAWSPDGRRIVAMDAQIGARIGTFSTTPFWIPANGGQPTHFGEKRIVNAQFGDLYFSGGDSDRVIEVQTSAARVDSRPPYYNLRCLIGRQSLLGSVTAAEAASTLSVLDAPRADPPWIERGGRDYPCAGAISPDGTQVVFRKINGELYLADLPQQFGTGAQTITLAPGRDRLISAEGLGGDSPAWSADGRLITFTFGHTLYLYEPKGSGDISRSGSLRAMPIDVAIPRDLPTGIVAFRNARLITMRGDEVIEQGDLVVRGRRIVAVGRAGTVSIPTNAQIVDAHGLTLIPGLLDLHNHGFTSSFETPVHDSRNAILETNLAFGVLNSRDPQSYLTDVLTTEDLIEAGRMLGPRIRTTFVAVGLSSGTYLDTVERARQIVHRYGESGLSVEYMKEYTSGPRRQRQYLVMAAAAERLNVTSHGVGLKHLITNAIDGYGGFDHPVVASPLYDDVLQLLSLTGIPWADNNWNWALPGYFVPRLSQEEQQKVRRLYRPREFGGLSGSLDKRLEINTRSQPPNSGEHDDPHAAIEMARILAKAIRKGVHIVNGSHGDDVPGLGTHLQIWAYVEGGAAPLEALRASTLRSADALDWGADLGSLEVGKLADLIVLEQNPLERIQNTIAIRYVMFSGRLYDAETLAEVALTRKQ